MFLFLMTSLTEEKKDRPDSKKIDACIKGIASGEESALEELYKLTSSAVYAYALSVVKNRFDAEDIMHDCYINIFRSAAEYRSHGKPAAWIFTIAKNLALKKISLQNRMTELDTGRASDTDVLFEKTEADIVLKKYFEVLSEEEREIVVMHAVWGFKHRETAAELKLPLSTVLSKYNRAVKKLKLQIERERIANE